MEHVRGNAKVLREALARYNDNDQKNLRGKFCIANDAVSEGAGGEEEGVLIYYYCAPSCNDKKM